MLAFINHEMELNNVCLLVCIFQAAIMFSFDVYVISHRILRTNYYTKSSYIRSFSGKAAVILTIPPSLDL